MADIDSTINAYLIEDGYSFVPVAQVVVAELEAPSSLPNTRYRGQRYEGELAVSFPNTTARDAFISFWTSKLGPTNTWTWTNPTNSVVYTCKFRDNSFTYRIDGPESHEIGFRLLAVSAA